MTHTQWTTTDYRLDQSGHEAVFLNEADNDRPWTVHPVVAWLTQANGTAQRIIGAIVHTNGELRALDAYPALWRILGPGDTQQRSLSLRSAYDEWRRRNPDAEATGWPARELEERRLLAEREAEGLRLQAEREGHTAA